MAKLKKNMPRKLVMIIDCGMGNSAFLTRQAYAAMKASVLWIGPENLLHDFDDIPGEHRKIYLSDRKQVLEEIDESGEQVVALLAEGEPGGCRSAFALKKMFDVLEPVVVPGISKTSYLAAVTGISADHAAVLNPDNSDDSIVPAVRRHETVFLFTRGHIERFLKMLEASGETDLKVCIVENPGLASENILKSDVREAAGGTYPAGSALIVTRKKCEGIRQFGLRDSEFIRSEGIPMTKSEIRALVISRMMIAEDDIIYDVGAGTGSVSVECALAAPLGHVYAIERKEEGIGLIRANAEKFGLENVTPVYGTAPAALAHLPSPDAAFIGGSAGNMKELIEVLHSRNPRIRITATAVTLETVLEAAGAMEGFGMETEITQIQASVSRKAGSKHMMTARNPIYLISGMSEETGGVG